MNGGPQLQQQSYFGMDPSRPRQIDRGAYESGHYDPIGASVRARGAWLGEPIEYFVTEVTFQPGFKAPLHSHPNELISFLLRGSAIDHEQGKRLRRFPGLILMSPATVCHEHQAGPFGAEVLSIAASRNVLALRKLHTRAAPMDAHLWHTVAMLRGELRQAKEYAPSAIANLVERILILCGRALELPPNEGAFAFADEATLALANAMPGSVPLGDVASSLGVSVNAFRKRFLAAVGVTPSAYVRYLRLWEALFLIERSRIPLKEIAATTGFSDQSHLTHELQSSLGVSPQCLREGTATDR